MTDRELEIIRLTIAACKREVEKVIGEGTLDAMDDGSPWGRAFLEITSILNDGKQTVSQ